MAPRWLQDGPNWPQDGPRWPQDVPKRPQVGPKMAPRGAQDGPKTAPRRPQDASKNDLMFTSSGITAKNSPRGSQDPPKRPPDPLRTPPGGPLRRDPPRSPQDPSWEAPGGLQDPPEASKTPPWGFQSLSKCKADVDIDVNATVYADGLSCIAQVNIDKAAGGLRGAIPNMNQNAKQMSTSRSMLLSVSTAFLAL